MKGIGNRLNKYYKKVKSTFFRLVNDIRNIKGIGIYSLLKRNKVSKPLIFYYTFINTHPYEHHHTQRPEIKNMFSYEIWHIWHVAIEMSQPNVFFF